MSRERKGPQDRADINVRRVVGTASAVVVVILLALALARALLAGLGAGIHDPPRTPRELPPAPREQVRPVAAYQQYRASEQAKLTSYGWVDREAGIVQIPIERAMALVARDEPGATSADGKRR